MSYTLMKQRHDTTVNWETINPVLKEGQIGVDITTKCFKIGDGTSRWNNITQMYIPTSVFGQKGDLLVGSGPNAGQKLPRGTTGQRLTVMSDGSLAWLTTPTPAEFETSAHALATYESDSASSAAHATKISSASMASTYETIANEAAAHALLLTSAGAAATYETISGAASGYEPKWINVLKLADTTVSNSTTLFVDPDLKFAALASSMYIFELFLLISGNNTDGIKLTIYCPTGTVNSWGVHGQVANLTPLAGGSNFSHNMKTPTTSIAAAVSLGLASSTTVNTSLFVTIKGIVETGVTAGDVGLEFAQNSASSTAPGAVVNANSFLRVRKIS